MTTMETIMDNGGVLGDADFIITLGDFNAHHSMWEVTGNEHLYRKPADRARGERVVRFTADYGLSMALPPGLATLRAHGSKNLTRPDNIFCSPELMDYLVSCDVSEPDQPPRTDHYPILLELDLSVPESAPCERWDWRGADMAKYDEALASKLAMHAPPRECATRGQFDSLCLQLETALSEAREETIKKLRPSPYQKRWWNSALDAMRERVQELGRRSHHFRSVRDHPVHRDFRQTQDAYGDAIEAAKSTHWEEWLESIDAESIWIAHRYTGDIPLGSRSARIPTLSVYDAAGNEEQASDNESKGRAFYDCFFPQHPGETELPELDDAARNWEPMRVITREQIQRVASNLSPYKAPGDDDIPNIVLKSCIDTLLEWLYWIFQACATRGFYRDNWRHFITVVLRKPGRATYKVAKSFRPVALYRTTPKLLHACICEDISYIVETENLLPNTHFGGRPRRTTTDSLHLLTQTVKDAWRCGDVATVLFLDTAGAFPNAVPERLCHNMRARRVPEGYVRFVETMLRGRSTCLRFDDHETAPFDVNNGIGQGDPLSMILYLFYNADMLDIPRDRCELALGFVDDLALIATARTFAATHDRLKDMMEREGGGCKWATEHNSPWEFDKTKAVDFGTPMKRAATKYERHDIVIASKVVQNVDYFKFLGVLVDRDLSFKRHAEYATQKGMRYVSQMSRLARTTKGVAAEQLRRLYVAVVIPKMTYAADVWFTPIRSHASEDNKTVGSATFAKKLASVQRAAAIRITGAMRTSPGDLLDVHADLWPVPLLMDKVCYRATLRMCTLSSSHPLSSHITRCARRNVKRHRSPVHELFDAYGLDPTLVEKIPAFHRDTKWERSFTTTIAESREIGVEADRLVTGVRPARTRGRSVSAVCE